MSPPATTRAVIPPWPRIALYPPVPRAPSIREQGSPRARPFEECCAGAELPALEREQIQSRDDDVAPEERRDRARRPPDERRDRNEVLGLDQRDLALAVVRVVIASEPYAATAPTCVDRDDACPSSRPHADPEYIGYFNFYRLKLYRETYKEEVSSQQIEPED